MSVDFEILYFIQTLRSDWLDWIMTLITHLGDAGIFWILLSVILACKKETRLCGFTMMISLLMMQIIGNMILKEIIARPRPCWLDDGIVLAIAEPESFSFPSGHTYSSFVCAVTILFFNKKWGAAALILAALIAFSRMYLFVHFPSDILGGIVLGILTAFAAKWLSDKFVKNRLATKG